MSYSPQLTPKLETIGEPVDLCDGLLASLAWLLRVDLVSQGRMAPGPATDGGRHHHVLARVEGAGSLTHLCWCFWGRGSVGDVGERAPRTVQTDTWKGFSPAHQGHREPRTDQTDTWKGFSRCPTRTRGGERYI